MHERKIYLGIILLTILFSSTQFTQEGTASIVKTNFTHDTIIKTLSVTIVNATIYDSISSAGSGNIQFNISIENNMYASPTIYTIDTHNGPVTKIVNWTVTYNLSLQTSYFKIEVWDIANPSTLDFTTDYLGYFNITNLAVGTIQKSYNTTGAIGGSPDPQVTLLVKTVITQQDYFIPPVITLNSPKNMTYAVGSTNNFLNFSIYDDNPNNFTLQRNNVTLYSGGWKNDAIILFNIDGLSIGQYNFTITALDIYSSKTVLIIPLNVTFFGSGGTNGLTSGANNGPDTRRTIPFGTPEIILLTFVVMGLFIERKRKR